MPENSGTPHGKTESKAFYLPFFEGRQQNIKKRIKRIVFSIANEIWFDFNQSSSVIIQLYNL